MNGELLASVVLLGGGPTDAGKSHDALDPEGTGLEK